ncbi:uncharacterized protein VTP21DRAFT_5774 [Calcarisporiella thermophila]|uniref:uncharacterized protein n=1 Tax=Calcarisporiella thermophila TaxID=911321 RepID=UPI003744891C
MTHSTRISRDTSSSSTVFSSHAEDEFTTIAQLTFFERVRDLIPHKHTYNEFLKLINLFNQGLVDPPSLIHRAEYFIGADRDLFALFRRLLGEEEESGIKEKLNESYRQLPANLRHPKCSGQDELCNSVLNTEWMCHPSHNTLEAGFKTHHKNSHEEILLRTEDEMYEVDRTLLWYKQAINGLEAIRQELLSISLDTLAEEELLKHWGDIRAIYFRYIKKPSSEEIFSPRPPSDSLMGLPKIIEDLHNKLETLTRYKESNLINWRNAFAKNYLKALDHKSTTFKNEEKRMLNPRSLITEIEARRQEAQAHGHDGVHVWVKFEEYEVYTRVIKLLASGWEEPGITPEDKDKYERFLREFLSQLLQCEDNCQNNGSKRGQPARQGTIYFFSGDVFYCFLRLLEIVYSRLLLIKRYSTEIATRPSEERVDLSALDRDLFPEAPASPSSDYYYEQFLRVLQMLLASKIDQLRFEEYIRGMFGIQGYIVFTMEKLIRTLWKQFQAVVSNSKMYDLERLFHYNRKLARFDSQKLTAYRFEVQAILMNENTYMIKSSQPFILSIQLLGRADSPLSSREEFARYLENYAVCETTEPALAGIKPPFLIRNILGSSYAKSSGSSPPASLGELELNDSMINQYIENVTLDRSKKRRVDERSAKVNKNLRSEELKRLIWRDGMNISFSESTYRIIFDGGEDMFFRKRTAIPSPYNPLYSLPKNQMESWRKRRHQWLSPHS